MPTGTTCWTGSPTSRSASAKSLRTSKKNMSDLEKQTASPDARLTKLQQAPQPMPDPWHHPNVQPPKTDYFQMHGQHNSPDVQPASVLPAFETPQGPWHSHVPQHASNLGQQFFPRPQASPGIPPPVFPQDGLREPATYFGSPMGRRYMSPMGAAMQQRREQDRARLTP